MKTSFSFFYLWLCGSLLLRGLFSSCGRRRLLSSCRARVSHRGDFCCGAWALGLKGFSSCEARFSVVAARGVSSRGSWDLERRLSSGGVRAKLLCSIQSSWSRDWILVSWIGRQILYHWVTREALIGLWRVHPLGRFDLILTFISRQVLQFLGDATESVSRVDMTTYPLREVYLVFKKSPKF